MDSHQRKEIGELYIAMYDLLIAYAQSALGSKALAQEAIQETFRIACERPEKLLESENPRGWLVNALKYTIMGIRTKQKAAQRLLEDCQAVIRQDMQATADNIISLDALYGDLTQTEEFKLLSEMVIEGRSHKEMAQSRGISVSACKKRVQRAKEFLRNKIEK